MLYHTMIHFRGNASSVTTKGQEGTITMQADDSTDAKNVFDPSDNRGFEQKPQLQTLLALVQGSTDMAEALATLLRHEQSSTLFGLFMHHLPGAAFIKDLGGRYLYLNKAYLRRLNVHKNSWHRCTAEDFWCPETVSQLEKHDREVLEHGKPLRLVERLRQKNGGKEFVHEIVKFPIQVQDDIVAIGGYAVDVSRRQRAVHALQASEQSYRVMAEYTHDWETWIGSDGLVRFVSPACEEITGYPRENFVQEAAFVEQIIHVDDLQAYKTLMQRVHLDQEKGHLEFRVVRPDGWERWISMHVRRVYDHKNLFLGLRSSCRDLTERKLLELRLQHEAFHDALTGLPNRTLCLDRITQALERSKRRENYHYAVIFLDLDRFKLINDSLGHCAGDQLLSRVAKRLQETVRSLDTVARLGGDEFVVLLEEISTVREAIRIVKRLRNAVLRPFDLSGQDVHISASIGIVLSPALYDHPEDLLRNANIAMHRAKALGRNRFKVFHTRMLEEAVRQMRLESDLRLAMEREEFVLLYQPILSLQNGRVTALEALLRWNHPAKGLLCPCDFLSVAEDTGLLVPLGEWVLREACARMTAWREENEEARNLTINVNLSLKQLRHPNLAERLSAILNETGLPPACLKLEVPENALMDNPEVAVIVLGRLKALGVQLSVDDFGAGYSSLSYLQRFPIDTLKVDRSFISRMEEGPRNREVVRAVIALAHGLNLDVVAEGVEVEEQRSLLTALECEKGQGFLFSRPVDKEIAGQLLLPRKQKFTS